MSDIHFKLFNSLCIGFIYAIQLQPSYGFNPIISTSCGWIGGCMRFVLFKDALKFKEIRERSGFVGLWAIST